MRAWSASLWKSGPIFSTDTREAVLISPRSMVERVRALVVRAGRGNGYVAASVTKKLTPAFPQHFQKADPLWTQAEARFQQGSGARRRRAPHQVTGGMG